MNKSGRKINPGTDDYIIKTLYLFQITQLPPWKTIPLKSKMKGGKEKDLNRDDEDWVHGLKNAHEENILDSRGLLCSDIMRTAMKIVSKQFKFQTTNFAPILYDESFTWKCNKKISATFLTFRSNTLHM